MTFRRSERLRRLVPLLLVAFLVLRGAMDWRHFGRFLGDHGWYLRVAERVAAGEFLCQGIRQRRGQKDRL